MTACLVWKDWPYRVHPHGLVGKDCSNGLCEVVLKPQTNPKHRYERRQDESRRRQGAAPDRGGDLAPGRRRRLVLEPAPAGRRLFFGGFPGQREVGRGRTPGSCGFSDGGSHLPSTSLLPGSFSNLGIQCVKKKEIEAAIEKKLQLGIDPFKGGGGAQAEPFLGAKTLSLRGIRIPWGCPRPVRPLTVPSPLAQPVPSRTIRRWT